MHGAGEPHLERALSGILPLFDSQYSRQLYPRLPSHVIPGPLNASWPRAWGILWRTETQQLSHMVPGSLIHTEQAFSCGSDCLHSRWPICYPVVSGRPGSSALTCISTHSSSRTGKTTCLSSNHSRKNNGTRLQINASQVPRALPTKTGEILLVS